MEAWEWAVYSKSGLGAIGYGDWEIAGALRVQWEPIGRPALDCAGSMGALRRGMGAAFSVTWQR